MLIAAGNESEWTGPTGNNTYLLNGDVPTLIDAGVGNPTHVAAVDRALAGRPLELLLITHNHPDHASGVPALRTRWPAVRVRKMPPGSVDAAETLQDGDRVRAGDASLLVVATPGHSPDHCCFLDEAHGDLYCGDLVRAGGTVVIPAGRGGDLEEYLSSLRKVGAIHPRRLLPGHGPAIDDPAAIIEEYLRHRAERETQVLKALACGCTTADAIAGSIYVDLAPPLRAAASESVLAHLIKLRNEGRATDHEGQWILSRTERP